jgi:peptidoglycan/LPS O-acetylase OafA/YrhL
MQFPAPPLTGAHYRADLDGHRGYGMLAVLFAHAFPQKVTGGFVAVDAFFIISGFLITGIALRSLEKGTFTFLGFWAGRIRRLFPALIVVLFATLLLGMFTLAPSEMAYIAKHIAAAAGFSGNIVLAGESGYFAALGDNNPVLHLWSLGVEEQFYLAWPLLLFLLWKRMDRFALVLFSVAVASFALNVVQVRTNPVLAYYSPLTRLWQVSAGALAAYAVQRRQPFFTPRVADALSIIGPLILVVTTLTFNESMKWPGEWALIPMVGVVFVLLVGPDAFFNRVVLQRPVAVMLGRMSYPVYLWHWPLLTLGVDAVAGDAAPGSVALRSAKIGAIVLSVVLAWVTWRFAEEPIRHGAKKAWAVPVLVTGMIAVCVAGLAQFAVGGKVFLVPNGAESLVAHRFDGYTAYRNGQCLLDPARTGTTFGDCTTGPADATESILLWGDSHAAHLYPGFRASLDSNVQFTQYSMGSCPPIPGLQTQGPECARINAEVMKRVAANPPDRVILAAGWHGYTWSDVEQTVDSLRALGTKRIDLVGPVPRWQKSLPVLLYHSMRSSDRGAPPERIRVRQAGSIAAIDSAMRVFAERKSLRYFSPWSIFCSREGCLTTTGPGPESIVAWDQAHLTPAGSIYVVSRFAR